MKLVHGELIEDIESLDNEVKRRFKRSQLMSRCLKIIELESILTDYNRQVLDSTFQLYRRMEPLYNNTRTYEFFLSTESDVVVEEVYSKINDYLDEFNKTNARVERFAQTIMQIEYDILLNSSVKRESSGEFSYSFEVIRQEKNLRESIRRSQQWYNAMSEHYFKILNTGKELDSIIRLNYELLEK